MVIREAREIDMGAIAELCLTSLLPAYESLMEPGQAMPWTEGEDVEKYIRGNWPSMRVAWQDDNLVGLIAVNRNHIDLIWIAEATRQQGLGQQMVHDTEVQISETYDEVSVECLNPETIQFFEQRGYLFQREFKDGMSGIKKVVMVRSLAELADRE
jgi:ribosomal protein S18 acetylase RimI-like enzyme